MNYYDYQRMARCKAIEILNHIGINKTPINVCEIIEHMENIILKNDNLDGDDGFTVYFDDFDKFLLCYDGKIGFNRSRFTVAHELGHIVLNHFKYDKVSLKFLDYTANSFANELLLPRFLLEGINGVFTYKEISKYFKVNKPVIDNRLKHERLYNDGFIGECVECKMITFFNDSTSCSYCGLEGCLKEG